MILDSEIAANLAQVRALVINTFDSKPIAESWLTQYQTLLGAAPIVVARSLSEFVKVQKILNVINYGQTV